MTLHKLFPQLNCTKLLEAASKLLNNVDSAIDHILEKQSMVDLWNIVFVVYLLALFSETTSKGDTNAPNLVADNNENDENSGSNNTTLVLMLLPLICKWFYKNVHSFKSESIYRIHDFRTYCVLKVS